MGLQLNVVVLSLLLLFTSTTKAEVFDIVAKYQAKADGKTDISTAPIEFKLQGTVMAPADPHFFKDPNWVVFNNIDISHCLEVELLMAKEQQLGARTTALRTNIANHFQLFNFVTNAMIRDITTKDSKQFNVNVLGCKNVTFEHFTVSNPEDSINTDGIHLGRSDGVYIQYSDIKTGDDCISVGDGMKNLHVNGVSCGPGHGISVGSLGKFQGEGPIEGIFIKNCTITGTQNGVRIKSWPASYPGTASDMHFEDIKMDNVGNPILIDQEYCPWNLCNLKMPSKIKLSKISFKNIKGTCSTKEAVKLVCSSSHPCDNVELANIDLTYKGPMDLQHLVVQM
ncbi:Glycoside hydrolase, family 28 [Corchorus olitorius]|uniref:Glycoside hydrolase, family 28 n=1 Tax=Corchorus olitorius TaxID=93759 RepID=A0A1R3KWB2_9ROSI|nr:Glycoside hydrolase, family 28 [Corchorus olitorius]